MLFGERQYLVIGILIILLSIGFFIFSFERRKPKTREVVLIAVLIAIAVVGRMAFFMTPQFKPCVAIIIIAGITLGKESGFLCGSMTAFVSDFFFGQGPWTPWQMFAFGIIGFLSAIIFSKKVNKIILCIYGFLVTFLIYGLIMDTATVLMYTDSPKISVFIASFITGIPFNIIHGISTIVFLILLGESMIKKIERIKIKYGMYSKNLIKSVEQKGC